ncbi:MAG: hypothetical protein Unbinned3818contig1000_22 [Prokaryotic dsDNA virus sp.]|nr:MAG: hypothetical protein Unbinned3818contig1000_22 [Prokaryotic dsDNA virus sp.]
MSLFYIYLFFMLLGVIIPYILYKYGAKVTCLLIGHSPVCVGQKTGLTFKEGSRGVNSTVRSIHKCARCGTRLDY